MNITTKELFELARIHSDGYDASGLDPDFVPWGEYLPGEQAAQAEGVRAVLEELKRRGWTEPYDNGGWIPPAEPLVFDVTDYEVRNGVFVIGAEPVSLKREPRVWQRIEEVPINVAVEDHDGDRWEYREGEWRGLSPVHGTWSYPENLANSPFTEIIKDPAEILADWEKELLNPDGPWDRWQDVPNGIRYRSTEDEICGYVNRDGVRMLIFLDDDEECESSNSEADMQAIAPFEKIDA